MLPLDTMTIDYFCRRMASEGACDMYSYYHTGIPNQLRLLTHIIQIAVRNKFWIKSLLVRQRNDTPTVNRKLYRARSQSQIQYIFRLMIDQSFKKMVLQQNWL